MFSQFFFGGGGIRKIYTVQVNHKHISVSCFSNIAIYDIGPNSVAVRSVKKKLS